MDPLVSELTNEIIDLCTKRLTFKQMVSFDGHIVVTVDNYQLMFLEIKHTHQKEVVRSSRSSHVPPKKKLQSRQEFYSRCESSEDERDHRRLTSAVSGEERSDMEKKEKGTQETKTNKKFKGDEKAKRHWKKGRKKAFTDEEASRQKEAGVGDAENLRIKSSRVGDTAKDRDDEPGGKSRKDKTKKGKRQKNSNVHACILCPFTSTYKHCLLRHHKRKHSEPAIAVIPTSGRKEVCSECNKTFKSKDSLRIHTSLIHGALGKRYPCTICNRVFYMKVHFEGHMNKHKNERPYTCTVCGKGFLYVQNVKRHERACGKSDRNKVKDESPIECKACGITFKTRDYYKDHMAAKHGQAPKYQCPVCRKHFRIRGSYYRHKMTCTKRQGLEPGEVHPDVTRNATKEVKVNALSEQNRQQNEQNPPLQQQIVIQQPENVVEAVTQTAQHKINHQSLPNMHQLYHHYQQVHPSDIDADHIQTSLPQRESYPQDPLQIQHYDILPQNHYQMPQQDLQTHVSQPNSLHLITDPTNLHGMKEQDILRDLQVTPSLKSTGHNQHGHHQQVRLLQDLQSQPIRLQGTLAENTQELLCLDSQGSHIVHFTNEVMMRNLQPLPQVPNDLDSSQGHRQHQDIHIEKQSQDHRMLIGSSKKTSSLPGQIYELQRQSHSLQEQSHDLQGQSHEVQRQAQSIRQHNSQHPADLNRTVPLQDVRSEKTQSHDQEQSHDILVLSHDLERSQNDPKPPHGQQQGPRDLSHGHYQLPPNSLQGQGAPSSAYQSHQKVRNMQVDIQSSQSYQIPLEMQSPHMLSSPSHGHNLEMQHAIHQSAAETSLPSEQTLQSPNIDVQCIISPYTWGKQVN